MAASQFLDHQKTHAQFLSMLFAGVAYQARLSGRLRLEQSISSGRSLDLVTLCSQASDLVT